jgi:hypothetical protein
MTRGRSKGKQKNMGIGDGKECDVVLLSKESQKSVKVLAKCAE